MGRHLNLKHKFTVSQKRETWLTQRTKVCIIFISRFSITSNQFQPRMLVLNEVKFFLSVLLVERPILNGPPYRSENHHLPSGCEDSNNATAGTDRPNSWIMGEIRDPNILASPSWSRISLDLTQRTRKREVIRRKGKRYTLFPRSFNKQETNPRRKEEFSKIVY